jgi:hypothetical protein
VLNLLQRPPTLYPPRRAGAVGWRRLLVENLSCLDLGAARALLALTANQKILATALEN